MNLNNKNTINKPPTNKNKTKTKEFITTLLIQHKKQSHHNKNHNIQQQPT